MSVYLRCPDCYTPYEGIEGSQNMTCYRCLCEFCIICGKKWEDHNFNECYQNQLTISQLASDTISNQIQIYIQFNSQKKGFLVHQTESVESLKDLVRQQYSIDPNNQKLVFSCCQLENGNTIQDYSIQNGATIHKHHHTAFQQSKYSLNVLMESIIP